MQILIIGGTGVLSSAVTEVAIKKSIKITMINRGNHRIPENVELIKSDRRNFDFIKKSLQGRTFDAVMDFLCYSDEDTEESVRFYSNYTIQYFFIKNKRTLKKIVFFSSDLSFNLKYCIIYIVLGDVFGFDSIPEVLIASSGALTWPL